MGVGGVNKGQREGLFHTETGSSLLVLALFQGSGLSITIPKPKKARAKRPGLVNKLDLNWILLVIHNLKWNHPGCGF